MTTGWRGRLGNLRRLGPMAPTLAQIATLSVAVALAYSGPVIGQTNAGTSLALTSPAFKSGADIPKKFTCQGDDVSPALAWNAPPAGTASFALIMDDPDAPGGTFVHWVVYDLPASARGLPEGVAKVAEISSGGPAQAGGRQGTNDFPALGYGGPCPPPGRAHRYFFKLYALSATLDLKAGATKQDVERAMEGRVLAQAELMGRFRR